MKQWSFHMETDFMHLEKLLSTLMWSSPIRKTKSYW